MDSIRKWFYRPKREDRSLLAQFFYADESLNGIACELDSFDGRQEPERCSSLVNQLRHWQDRVLSICNEIMDELIPDERANRDFRVKFPDDVMQENLAGQLWFGAECLAAGSSILNREAESSAMRPLAKALTKSLEIVRNLLREHALRGYTDLKAALSPWEPATDKLIESLKIFDRLFADFELAYVGAMVPVKSTKEYEQQELVCVLFSETLQRALERGLLNQSDVDNYEPALMFTIPRLAIVAGLLAPPGGPLCLSSADSISEMFRPFRSLLIKIRELLWTLNNKELYMLEKLLCSMEETSSSMTQASISSCQEVSDLDQFVCNFYSGYPNCKDFIADFYTVTRNNGTNMDEVANEALLILDQDNNTRSRDSKKERRSRAASSNPQKHPDALVSEVPTARHNSSGSSDFYSCDSVSVEIPPNEYAENQTSSEKNEGVPVQNENIPNSISELDSRKLIAEANKSLSNLLLDTNDCQNENSEQTDSGICTVISSENTSLYDRSPEEKRNFPSDVDEQQTNANERGETQHQNGEEENTSYSCSNLNSPKRRNSNKSENSCVCSSRSQSSNKTNQSYMHPSLDSCSKQPSPSGLSAQISGSSEEIIGVAYGSGQLPVCDGNHHSTQQQLQINYNDNWESLSLNIGGQTSSTRREFWSEIKRDNGSQHPRSSKQQQQRRRAHRHRHHHHQQKQPSQDQNSRRNYTHHLQPPESAGSSRSNSAERVNKPPRLVNFGASLHPNQNIHGREMARLDRRSPSRSSPRADTERERHTSGKLLENRRSRRGSSYRHYKSAQHRSRQAHEMEHSEQLINDGLGPRTNKSGIVESPSGSSVSKMHGRCIKSKLQLSDASTNIRDLDSSLSGDSSSETSEFQSDCQDDEEIALAMQAAEIANRNQIRAKFRSSEDLVHRLFVCIAGVADQLQTNFASDLRNILKCVFLMNSTQSANEDEPEQEDKQDSDPPPSPVDSSSPSGNESPERQPSIDDDEAEEHTQNNETHIVNSSMMTERGVECVERAPVWVPDSVAPRCMACQAGFTVVRRRHHCRNCGKVFCGRCSGNSVPLPRFGHTKPVRVCNRCFLFQVTPFTVSQITATPTS